MNESLNIPKRLYLYDEGVKGLDFKRLKEFINKNFGKISIKSVRLKKRTVQTKGILFDHIRTNETFDRLGRVYKDACHIILTDKLFATYDEDGSLHIRAAIFSFPSIISTSGIVEGLAKPKEYYILKTRYSLLGIWPLKEEALKKEFKGRFIDYQDPRLIEVMKGYLAQAIFYFMIGEPFCPKKTCRLYNSHWQEDLICSQIKIGKFCPRHKRILHRE